MAQMDLPPPSASICAARLALEEVARPLCSALRGLLALAGTGGVSLYRPVPALAAAYSTLLETGLTRAPQSLRNVCRQCVRELEGVPSTV